MTGKTHTEEAKEKNRQAHLGKKMSEESIRKTAEKNRGQKRSEETKEKIRDALKNHKRTEDHNSNLSKAKLGVKQDLITCPHCGKVGGYPAMQRWKHIEKCKEKYESTNKIDENLFE